MPRHRKGPHLNIRPARRGAGGRVTHQRRWIIKDGSREFGTGFGLGDREQAEKALANYIAEKYQPERKRGRDPAQISVADVIGIWLEDKAPAQSRPEETGQRATALLRFFGNMMLGNVTEAACKSYAKSHSRSGAAKRHLEDLRAAIIHHHRQGYCSERIAVWLPPRGDRRERWIDREEAARMLRALWRARDPLTGRPTRRHAARFFLVALYTGTRSGAVCGAAVRPTIGRGHIDLEAGLFYRKSPLTRETNKRQPPVTLPKRLLTHMRRWVRLGISQNFIVEWNGKPVKSVRTAWESARDEAGLGSDVIRHTLRHTATMWLTLNGTDIGKAADFLGMSVETLHKHYRHHHPDYQREAAENICRPPLKRPQIKRTDQEHTGAIRSEKPQKRKA
jgi:hypothetical protein